MVARNIIVQLVKSISLTLLVAGIFSFFIISITGLNFLPIFFFLVLLQFLFFYFYGEYIKNKNNKLQVEAEIKIAEKLSQQETTVMCPCDQNVPATIPININGPNSYICKGCNKEITVFIEAKTALATKPVTTNPLTEPYFLDDVKKYIKNDNRK